MSSTIDKLIDTLENKLDKAEGGGDVKMEIVDDLEKKVKKVKDASQSDKKQARKQISKLKDTIEQGQDKSGKGGPRRAPGTRKKGGAKANPQPPNVNTEGVRCYIRYNNQGIPYRTCNDDVGKKPRKTKSQITPLQSAEDYAEQHGGYTNLGKGQIREYHRLDMAKRRSEDRVAREGGVEIVKLQQLALKQEKARYKAEKLEEKIKKQQRRQDKLDYKEAYKKLTKAERNPSTLLKLKKKFNQKEQVFKNEIKELKKEKEEQDDIYENIQEEIKDGIKSVKNEVGANVELKTGGNIAISFD